MISQIPKEQVHVFHYDRLPSCARACKVLQIAEENCVPATTPGLSLDTFLDCVCQSGYLRPLYASGAICHDVCSNKDDAVVRDSYELACGTPVPSMTKLSTSTSMIATMTKIATFTSMIATMTSSPPVVETTTSSLPTPPEPEPEAHGNWLKHNGKYFAIAAGMIFILVAIILLTLSLRRHCAHTRDLESSRSWIRLRRMPSLSREALSHNEVAVWPYMPCSPTHRFGDTIRAYAPDSPNNSNTGGAGPSGVPNRVPGAPVRSLSRMERRIRERIRTTGRPDLPMSAIPKIRR
ncbi:integral membrane [Pyrenophora seminiperda CCB06]|uniref:Integral membrane n=1 Tax=Pyrenophora seminiperda CCB06 TaxID=1302712 RepID=A0A3M7MHH6_9PLEO|nr:integral membrane [Pyrenophora seminiperda CCB06]